MRFAFMLFLVFVFAACSSEGYAPCGPACPATSVCMDADGLGTWECYVDTEPAALACNEDSHCPTDGACSNQACLRHCGCIEDAACPETHLCVTEDQGCGLCLPASDFACGSDSDCAWVVDLRQCCACPKARSVLVRDGDPCLVDSPFTGEVPADCRPDCTQVDHCWPCPPGADQVNCTASGICRQGS